MSQDWVCRDDELRFNLYFFLSILFFSFYRDIPDETLDIFCLPPH